MVSGQYELQPRSLPSINSVVVCLSESSDEVSTGSGSDRVSIHTTIEFVGTNNPVATAPGTDYVIVISCGPIQYSEVGQLDFQTCWSYYSAP
jgi:hypothetical protein